MYLSVLDLYRYVETMRPEVSDETKKMVESATDICLDNPTLSASDLTFDQQIQLICENWHDSRDHYMSGMGRLSKPWEEDEYSSD